MLNPEHVKFNYLYRTVTDLSNINHVTYDPHIVSKISTNSQSIIIESLLLRIPISRNFLCSFTNENLTIYTNQHKLYSILDYIDNKFPLCGLEYFNQYNNLYYNDLAGMVQRRIGETNLILVHIDQETPCTVRNNIISRMNQN